MSTYYIDPDGSDSSAGTSEEEAWATLAKVNASTFAAGDSILFKRGGVWRETLTVPSSGTEGSPITFGAYGSGEKPVISGSDLVTDGWASNVVVYEDFTDASGSKPISWWMFEDAATTAIDGNTTNNNDLTWEGDSVRSSTHVQGSYSLSTPYSNSNAISTALALSANFPLKAATTDFTIGGRVYLKANASAWFTIAAFGDESSTGMYIGTSGTAGQIRARVYVSGGSVTIDSAATYSSDAWHSIVVRWNGSNVSGAGGNDEISLWIDGVKEAGTGSDAAVVLSTSGIALKGSSSVAINFDEWFAFAVPLLDTQIASIHAHGLTGATSGTANVWQTAATTQPKVVYFDGTRGANVASVAAIDSEYKWYWASDVLYVYSPADDDPSGHYTSPGIEAGARSQILNTNNASYVTVDGLTTRDANATDDNMVNVGTTSVTGVVFRNCVIERGAGYGIELLGSITAASVTVDNCTIRNNGAWGVYFGYQYTTATISNNVITGNGWGSARDSAQYDGIAGILGNVHVVGNTIYDNTQGTAYGAGLSHGIYYAPAAATVADIHDNVIYGHTNGDGIKTRGPANIYRNTVYGNYYNGIEVGGNGAGNIAVAIYQNTVYGNNVTNAASGGIVEEAKDSGTIAISIYENTLYQNAGTNAREILIADDMGGAFTLKNNAIFTASTGRTMQLAVQSGAVDIDYNLHWRADGAPEIRYGDTYPSWTQWKALGLGGGPDAHGVNADPLFTNAGAGDFTLQAGSPAIAAGVYIESVSIIDPPSMGAIERGTPHYYYSQQ